MMKIIMLAGASQTGKTTTLLKVYGRLFNNSINPKTHPKFYQEINNNTPPDIECYPLYHHDKKVALCTAGDTWECIKRAITKFNCIGADVLIIAFSEDKIKKEAEKNKDIKLFHPDVLKDIQPHCVIQKRVSSNQNVLSTDNDENNEKDCQAIIDRI